MVGWVHGFLTICKLYLRTFSVIMAINPIEIKNHPNVSGDFMCSCYVFFQNQLIIIHSRDKIKSERCVKVYCTQ